MQTAVILESSMSGYNKGITWRIDKGAELVE